MEIDRIDHLVLTVRDIAATVEFYCSALGMAEFEPSISAIPTAT